MAEVATSARGGTVARGESLSVRWPWACCLLVVACKPVDVVLLEGQDGGLVSIDGLRSIRIDPAAAEPVIDRGEGARAEVKFTATGIFDDGERDVTDRVEWRVGTPRIGTIERGRFESFGVGGRSFVEARSGVIVATAPVEVRVDIIVDLTPTNMGASFPVAAEMDLTGLAAPVLVYPADGVVMPTNVSSLEPQWRHDPSHDTFELRIESVVARVRVITTSPSVRIDAASPLEWILRAHGGSDFSMYVRSAALAAPQSIYRSNTVAVTMAPHGIDGTGYFMSMGPPAILRTRFGADSVQQVYPPFDETTRCTGCHAVARNGRRLATTRGEERLTMVDLESREPFARSPEREFEWGAFNPDGSRLVYVDEGRLRVVDVDSNVDLPGVPLPAGAYATHPDWSPDGRFLVVAYSTDEKPEKYEFKETSLARIDVAADGTFSMPSVLEQVGRNEALVFPSISWDGRFVAFVRAEGEEGRGPNATIELIPADGGRAIRLGALNERVGTDLGVTGIRNLMPTWIPTASTERMWLAFSSRRVYGIRRGGDAGSQLWISAITPAEISMGLDPSAPAFWYPPQPIVPSNYRLQFSTGDGDQCSSIVELCNDVDDDCDDVVDESCCTPAGQEVCGNLVDDDCDGLVDETCTCDGPEICNNGLDDDCDREIDGRDDDCP